MEIKVFNEESIQHFKTDQNFAVISILSPNREINLDFIDVPNFVAILELRFHDVDDRYVSNFKEWSKERKLVPFTISNADSILTFVKYVEPLIDILCVHCEAGISRSAGVAAALAKIYNGDDFYYFKNYCPNKLVYKTILNEYYKER